MVDPLDGTVNFLYGVPIFAVSVAAAVDGEVVAGAVIDVLRGEMFSAQLGGGARCDGEPIAASACAALAAALVVTGFSYQADQRARQGEIVHRLLLARPRRALLRLVGARALLGRVRARRTATSSATPRSGTSGGGGADRGGGGRASPSCRARRTRIS